MCLAAGCAATPPVKHRAAAADRPTTAAHTAVPPTATSSPPPVRSFDSASALAPAFANRIDAAAHGALARREVVGAAMVVVRRDGAVLRRTYGLRAVEPAAEPMTLDTVFDLASLTKPIVTATLAMKLEEQGRLSLSDPLSRWFPEAASGAFAKVTIEQLLRHHAGLPAANSLAHFEHGPADARRRMLALAPAYEPGTRRLYSDVGYLLLGMVIEQVEGKPLDEVARTELFKPLGAGLCFQPDRSLIARAAPTERLDGRWLRAVVHDLRARALGGVAGHAGLFATADDVARFARMVLRGGELDGVRVLSEPSVARLTALHAVEVGKPPSAPAAAPTSLLGSAFAGGLAHSGFTGTYLWIDVSHDLALVLLTSRLHPDGKGDAARLRREVVAVVAEAAARGASSFVPTSSVPAGSMPAGSMPAGSVPAASMPSSCTARVRTGIDVEQAQAFGRLAGHRVGLLTHAGGRSCNGQRTVDLLAAAPNVELVRLFSPEHGLDSSAEGLVAASRDPATGLPIVSLYGKNRRPRAEHLAGIDTVVVDLQDAGVRYYTYETTLGYLLEAAAAFHKRVVVLDRPNPVGGRVVEGPARDDSRESFVGYHPLPIRHGLTLGELARLFRSERKLAVELEVVPMTGWRRDWVFADTGLEWVAPSPNLRSPEAALLYPGTGWLEGTNLSVGRGTARPFEWVGAPWIEEVELAAALEHAGLAGVAFAPTTFTPTASTYAGQPCRGVAITVTDPQALRSVRVGLELAVQLHARHPQRWQVRKLDSLLGSRATLESLDRGESAASIAAGWQQELTRFEARRAPSLLY